MAVVTGGGAGLGRAHALALGAAGAHVLVNDADGDAASAVAGEIAGNGGEAAPDGRALGTVADGRALVAAAIEWGGTLDVVVNNAGVSRPRPVVALSDESVTSHLGVHLLATIGSTAAALPVMAERGWGRVINTVSGHGLAPANPGSAAYAAAKAAVFGFTRAAALEASPGVTVNAVAPLAFTQMSEGYLSSVEGARERFAPEHVSRVILWLCGAGTEGVNGRVLRVEGDRVGEYDLAATDLRPFGELDQWLISG